MNGPRSVSRRWRVLGAATTAVAVVVQGLWLAARYPNAHLDADLLSYLAYYRDWYDGVSAPFGYTVPKVLPMVLFGPTGSPETSFGLTLAVASFGGAVVFLLSARLFGLSVATLAALAYVFDPLRSILTLRSSADLYVGVGLIAAMYALSARAVFWAGAAILLASLAKPLALVCALAVLVVPEVARSRRLLAATLPFAAVPSISALDAVLHGRSALAGIVSLGLPDQHETFVRVAQGPPLSWLDSLHMVFVDWFGTLLFARTWPLLLIGVGLYAGRSLLAWRGRGEESDPGTPRVDSRLVVLAIPILLTGAYAALAFVHPFVFFMRFFWVLAAALTILAAYGAIAVASCAPLPAWGRGLLVGVFAVALLADRYDDFEWRKQLMLDPFESHADLADRGVEVIADPRRCEGAAVVPLAYLPLAAWRVPGKLRRGELCATEDWAAGRGCADPTCVLVMPAAPTTPVAREAARRLLDGGWSVVVSDGHGALVRSTRSDERTGAARSGSKGRGTRT